VTPRVTILTAIKTLVAPIVQSQNVFDTFSEVIAAEAQRSIVVGPGERETFEDQIHPETGSAPTGVRRFPVRVICTAWTRDEADTIALDVEDAFPYGETADQIGASLDGATLTEYAGTPERPSERVYFSTVVDFTVLYERPEA
jgi:hypothetical protein